MWLTVSGFPGAMVWRKVVVTWHFSSRRFHLVSRIPPISRSKTRDQAEFDHFDFATSLPAGVGSREVEGRPGHADSGVIACPATLDLAVIFWPSVRLAEPFGSFDHLLHRSEPGCALVPVVEHVPRSEQTPTVRRRGCTQDPSFDETHHIGASDVEQICRLLRGELTIGADHVDRRACRQGRQTRPHGPTRFGREHCDLVAVPDARRQLIELERGNDGALSSVKDERFGVTVHATSIGDSQASAIGNFSKWSEPWSAAALGHSWPSHRYTAFRT